MNEISSATLKDLAAFVDLGTDAPRPVVADGSTVLRIVRNGHETELVLHPGGEIDERTSNNHRRHIDIKALLASPNFGDLGRWADAQSTFLKARVADEVIPIDGVMSGKQRPATIADLDDALMPATLLTASQVKILLVDGPAGIGKTSLIRALANRRAAGYRGGRRPLILHVESRGRMLQNVMDLMAFSLQTLRLSVTYDQVPALVRNGLITLAIDGFDELGDPNGYELAWAQVNELVAECRGRGSLLLAGRETFIGRERLIAALKVFKPETDEISTFSVRPMEPATAKCWLQEHGWNSNIFEQDNVEPLFEHGSYALRPFFLVELAREGVRKQVESGDIDDLTWFLVEMMIRREATKFGKEVDAVTTEQQRREFVRRFLGEIARDLADNQTEAIASESLAWLAEVAATNNIPASVVGILKNRAGVVAFLTEDDRRGYKRFSHIQLQNHFLGMITIDSVLSGEVPKYVRRNIFGADLLTSFADVVRNIPQDRVLAFARAAVMRMSELGDQDRSRRNLAALVLAIMGVLDHGNGLVLSDVVVDEAVVAETAGSLALDRVVVAQLDARGADLRSFAFNKECHVFSLIADDGTALSESFPEPQRIQLPDGVLTAPQAISKWMAPHRHVGLSGVMPNALVPESMRDHGLIELIGRVGRFRPFWIREGEEKGARRILGDEHWEVLRGLLERHHLLTVRYDRQASGPGGEFFHVRRKNDILAELASDEQIASFYRDVVSEVRKN